MKQLLKLQELAIFNNMCKNILQDLAKLENPKQKKSKVPTSSLLYSFNNEVINPNPKGISIIRTITEIIGAIESESLFSIKDITKNISI